MLNRNDKVEKKIQLFCLPYAGGKAQVFTTIFDKLSPDIDFIAIEYAGKGSRSKEEYFSQYAEFIDDITNQINCKEMKIFHMRCLGIVLEHYLLMILLLNM